MSYEEEFKKINNQVYNMNKDREEPFLIYWDSLLGSYSIIENEDDIKKTKPFISALSGVFYYRLKMKIDELKEIENKNDYEKALLKSLEIDLVDRKQKYHKDITRKFIE